MEGVKAYLLSILATAIICGFVNRIVRNRANGAVVRMASGIIMLLIVIQPLRDVEIINWKGFYFDMEEQISEIQEKGESEREKAVSQIIKEKTTAYIVKQAQSFHANISVDVILSDNSMPVPEYVRISGEVAPYAKQQLINIIERELGVARENQLWR